MLLFNSISKLVRIALHLMLRPHHKEEHHHHLHLHHDLQNPPLLQIIGHKAEMY